MESESHSGQELRSSTTSFVTSVVTFQALGVWRTPRLDRWCPRMLVSFPEPVEDPQGNLPEAPWSEHMNQQPRVPDPGLCWALTSQCAQRAPPTGLTLSTSIVENFKGLRASFSSRKKKWVKIIDALKRAMKQILLHCCRGS